MTAGFSGAVLCGGASRRMGRDKATLLIEGEAMAVRVASALRAAGATEVVAIGGDATALEALGLRVLPDDEPGEGPFPATITALRQVDAEIVVVLSCDLLAPRPAAIAKVVEHLRGSGPAVLAAVPVVEHVHQWTHAAWRRRALPELVAARRAGVGSLRRAASALTILEVPDLAAGDVADADDPHDLPGAR